MHQSDLRAPGPEDIGEPSRMRRRSFLVAAATLLAAMLAFLIYGALGSFGDTDSAATADAIDAGTLNISTTDASTTLSNAAPGDSYYMFVTVSNTGTLGARLAVTTTASPSTGGNPTDEALSQYLDADSQWESLNESTCTGANPSGPTVRTDGTTVVPLIGSLEFGVQDGDEVIGASSSKALCVRYNLALTAPNSTQNGVVDIDLDFHAEQAANITGAGGLYGVHDFPTKTLISINTSSGAGTTIGGSGFTFGRSLAFDTNTNTLYTVDTAVDSLKTIETATGAATSVGAVGFSDVRALAFDPNTDTLYGVDTITTDLITINTTTGAGTSVGDLGFTGVVAAAFDPNTNTLYGSDNTTGDLVTINTTTGAGTSVGDLGTQYVRGLAFDPTTNTLYGSDELTGDLVTINTTTGAATSVGDIGLAPVRALAFED